MDPRSVVLSMALRKRASACSAGSPVERGS
jgi:hypothetical protein